MNDAPITNATKTIATPVPLIVSERLSWMLTLRSCWTVAVANSRVQSGGKVPDV